jgi:hypothetical protein
VTLASGDLDSGDQDKAHQQRNNILLFIPSCHQPHQLWFFAKSALKRLILFSNLTKLSSGVFLQSFKIKIVKEHAII